MACSAVKSKIKFKKYLLLVVVTAPALWLYYQVDSYPYKVARWLHPVEVLVSQVFTRNCSGESAWLNDTLDYAFKSQGAYSVQVAHRSAEGKLFNCEQGYKKRLFGEQVNSRHRYRYASTSKLITVAAIFQLINQQKVSLDDRLVSFFPELSGFKDARIRDVTIADLLNHRAGFNRLTLNGDPMFLRQKKPWCTHDFHRLEEIGLSFDPGSKQIYSNLGFCILGEIVGRVSGESYRTFTEREYSLVAQNIKFVGDEYFPDEVRYDFRYEEWFNDSYLKLFDFEALSSVAGLSGSASDLANLLWNLHHNKNGSPFARKPTRRDCFGLMVLDCIEDGVFYYQPNGSGLALQFHTGYLPGVVSIAAVDSLGGVTVILKSGADRPQSDFHHEWIPWLYRQLYEHYYN